MKATMLILCVALTTTAQVNRITIPKIWDDRALAEWATPIAALGVSPTHYTSAEYYVVPGDNLKTYPVYRPDLEPPEYWEWLQKQKPLPLVDATALRSHDDLVKAGETAFFNLDEVWARTSDPERIAAARDLKRFDGIHTQRDGSMLGFGGW